MKLRLVSLTLMAASLFPWASAATQCTVLRAERVDYEYSEESRAIHAKRVAYAISVVQDKVYRSEDPDCVAEMIRYLGNVHAPEAIPTLVRLLAYKHEIVNPIAVLTDAQIYPAVGALIEIGKPAVPALLGAISRNEQDSTETKNAIRILASIYREEPGMGADVAEKAANAQLDQAERDPIIEQRLRSAAIKLKSLGCLGSVDTCKKAAARGQR